MLITPAIHQHYSCEYVTSTVTGQITGRRTISGDLETTKKLQTWSSVNIVQDGEVKPQKFMDGFHYDVNYSTARREPDIFREFPSTAVEAKDIVSDTLELLKYTTQVSQVTPGAKKIFPAAHASHGSEVTLTGMGTANIQGHRCAIAKFESYFNKVEFSVPEVRFVGRSHRWGEIWVDQASGVIVRAALTEDLLGELTMQNSKDPMTMNILRTGHLELK